MMLASILALGLASFANAAPSHAVDRRQAPVFPPHLQSDGFLLVANVTDLSKDLVPSINGFVLNSYHVGAGQAIGTLTAPSASSPGRLFYVNGTAYEVRYREASIITDGSQPLLPFGLTVQTEAETSIIKAGEHDVYINGGPGTKAVGLSGFPDPVSTLYANFAAGWAACNNTLPAGPAIQLEPTFATYLDADGNYDYQLHVPEGCVPVTLLPQCAVLNDVPEGSFSSHEFANVVNCYEDVKGIDWSVYSA